MSNSFESRLAALASASGDPATSPLARGRKGIEKESLRVDADGYLSTRPHPVALGSALTNPYITTDYSEALLEFVTPAYHSTWETLHMVCGIHQYTHRHLNGELLWASSMPCRVPPDAGIPLARYGSSNVGQMKTIYRRGLGFRYGRQMQTIAGVHFNYSLPDAFWPVYQQICGASAAPGEFRSAQYMGLVRNFRRFGWLLLYLFGASPALCRSFAGDAVNEMSVLRDDTLYRPYGTSLRMSDLGYNNQTQARININLNSVDEYVRDLAAAMRTPEPAYEKLGVKVDGIYRQLNANLLQIENEYYSSIRPKRVANSGERPTAALRRGGVEYVEVRSIDTNLFDPCGISQNTMRFLEAFLIVCAVRDSDPFGDADLVEASGNQLETAKRGRDPQLKLKLGGKSISLRDWGEQIFDDVAAVAESIDSLEQTQDYSAAVAELRKLLRDPDATPSARLLQELATADSGFFDYVLELSRRHAEYFASITPLCDADLETFDTAAAESLAMQKAIEAEDRLTLDEYLEQYFAPQNN